jgi:hypothetical protein
MVLENVLEAVAKQQVLRMTHVCQTRIPPEWPWGPLQTSPDYTKPPIRNGAGPLLQPRVAFVRL